MVHPDIFAGMEKKVLRRDAGRTAVDGEEQRQGSTGTAIGLGLRRGGRLSV